MDLSGNDQNKITGKKYQPVMSVTGLNDQGLYKQSASPIGIFEQNQNMFWYWDTSQLH